MAIPPGKVTTYKNIANAIDCKSSQAIGQALKRNPYNGSIPDVPCHRVIKTDLSVGGLSGSYSNADKKLARLQSEGVTFHQLNGQYKVDPSCIQQDLNYQYFKY
jgi:methylated-DNA-[protein]-cysteine S-methyltransferase